MILADEINRTPPKTQAALLEAMQEYQITAGGQRHQLSQPFFVLATQNPIEHEGTYPLPEAQLDRFMFNTYVDYPDEDEEFDIVRRTTADVTATVTPTLSGERILELQKIVRRVPVADHVVRYAMKLVRLDAGPATDDDVPQFIRDYVSWGAGPRASQYLVLGAKARAVLHGRFYAGVDDVRAVAFPVLRHRIVTNFNAEAEGIKPDELIRRLIDAVGDGDARGGEASAGVSQESRTREGTKGVVAAIACDAMLRHGKRPWKRPTTARSEMLARLQGLPLRAGGSSRATSRACIAARSTASRSSLPSTASTPPATTSLPRLESLRTHRQVLSEAVRGRDQPGLPPAAGHQREHALSERRGADVEAGICPAGGRGAGLPGAPPAGQRGPGHLRQRDPLAGPRQQQSLAPERDPARDGGRFGRAQDRHRADLPRPGRAVEEAGNRHRPERPVRRRGFDAGRAEAPAPPPARSDCDARARSGRGGFPVPPDSRCSAAWSSCPTCWSSPGRCARPIWPSSAAILHKLKAGCRAQAIDYVPMRTDQSLEVALSSYLASRG